MSRETIEHLNTNTLIGFTDKRGHAWHYRAEVQGAESNHYPGAIPTGDVLRRLFHTHAVEGTVESTATIITPDGVTTVTATDPTRKTIIQPDTGKILGIFKQGYKMHQFDEWLVRVLERILDGDLAVGSAGLLKDGAVAWVQVEMPETAETNGVKYRPFLTAATAMDGSMSSTYQVGVQLVVCDNTLSAALGEDVSRVKVKHSVNSLNRIQEVRDALGIIHAVADGFDEQVKALTEQVVTDDQWSRFVQAYTAPSGDGTSKRGASIQARKVGELNQLYRHDERAAPWKGSAYGVLAAVNTHTHHFATVKGATRAERNMERAVTGGADALDRSTLALLATV